MQYDSYHMNKTDELYMMRVYFEISNNFRFINLFQSALSAPPYSPEILFPLS